MSKDITINRMPVPDLKLICAVCLAQVLLIALPFYFSPFLSVLCVLLIISIAGLLGSTTSAVLYLCFMVAVIPTWMFDEVLKLPKNINFYEGIFVFIMAMSGVFWMLEGKLNWPKKTRLDRPVLALMALLVFSMALGLFYGQSVSQMLRDIRFPLCYSLFFVVTWFFDVQKFQTFLHLLIGATIIVGIEYLIEFLAMVNLAVSGSFFRVSRLEGVLFPIGILTISAILLLERRFYRRLLVGLGLLPTGLALLLTVGRGMWVALFVGLCVLAYLTWVDPLGRQKRSGRMGIVMFIPVVFIGIAYLFQAQTRTGIGDVASQRVMRVADNYEEDHSVIDRLAMYGRALEEIRKRPLLGGGHGVSIQVLTTDLGTPTLVTVGGVDSVYLTIAMRMGVVGVGVFLWVYCAGLWRAYQLFKQTEDGSVRVFCMAFIAVYSALLVFGIGDATLFVNRLIFIHATFLGILAKLDATYIKIPQYRES